MPCRESAAAYRDAAGRPKYGQRVGVFLFYRDTGVVRLEWQEGEPEIMGTITSDEQLKVRVRTDYGDDSTHEFYSIEIDFGS